MKKAMIVTLLAIISSLLIFALRLGLLIPNPVSLQNAGPFYLATMKVTTAADQSADDEIIILNTTRMLYDAGILQDGHKAKAVSLHYLDGSREAGLLLPDAIYKSIRMDLPDLHLQVVPGKIMLMHSIPRLNVLSLYVGKWRSIPALNDEIKKRNLTSKFRLEIFDKRIRYINIE